MKLLDRLLGNRPDTEAARVARRQWEQAGTPAPGRALDEVRWVVLDTETSGLDPRRDRLLSIGACTIEGGGIALSGTFEVLLQQSHASAVDNVLVHGIGHRAQALGEPQDAALAAYLRFSGKDVVVGYHTLFDLVMIDRATRSQLGVRYQPASVDLALLLPVLAGRADAAGWDLDRWLDRYRIDVFGRHHALADAFATAQLFLLVLQLARRQGLHRLRDLLRLQAHQLDLGQARG